MNCNYRRRVNTKARGFDGLSVRVPAEVGPIQAPFSITRIRGVREWFRRRCFRLWSGAVEQRAAERSELLIKICIGAVFRFGWSRCQKLLDFFSQLSLFLPVCRQLPFREQRTGRNDRPDSIAAVVGLGVEMP